MHETERLILRPFDLSSQADLESVLDIRSPHPLAWPTSGRRLARPNDGVPSASVGVQRLIWS